MKKCRWPTNGGSHACLAWAIVAAAAISATPRRDSPPFGPPAPVALPGQVVAVSHQDLLRYQICWRPIARGSSTEFAEVRPGPSPLRWIRCDYDSPTPLPEAGWARPDFDDSGWGRRAGPILGVLGHVRGDMASLSDAALLCVRAKFGITDPAKAKGAMLKLAYRGGAVVYLNGIEIARARLPQGKIDPLTLAEDYPPEMFRRTSTADQPRQGEDAEYLKRIRELSVELPPERLTQGANVLAIELHRTAVPDDKQGGKNA